MHYTMKNRPTCDRCGKRDEPPYEDIAVLLSIYDKWHVFYCPRSAKANKSGYVTLCCNCIQGFQEIVFTAMCNYLSPAVRE